MGLTGCYGVIKYILVFVNLIFWAFSLTTVVLAIWILTDPTFLVSLAEEQHNFYAGLYIMLAAGAVMLVVAFLGCCGAFRESQCMLVGFFSCLLLVMVAQIAAGAWLYANSNQLEDLVRSSVTNTIKNEYGVIESRTQTVDAFQSGLGCCGATGPENWAGTEYARRYFSDSTVAVSVNDSKNDYRIPESCCKDKASMMCRITRNLKVGDFVSPAMFSEGCMDKLVDALKSQSNIVFGVTIGVGILELFSLIFSLILCCAIGSSDRYKA